MINKKKRVNISQISLSLYEAYAIIIIIIIIIHDFHHGFLFKFET